MNVQKLMLSTMILFSASQSLASNDVRCRIVRQTNFWAKTLAKVDLSCAQPQTVTVQTRENVPVTFSCAPKGQHEILVEAKEAKTGTYLSSDRTLYTFRDDSFTSYTVTLDATLMVHCKTR